MLLGLLLPELLDELPSSPTTTLRELAVSLLFLTGEVPTGPTAVADRLRSNPALAGLRRLRVEARWLPDSSPPCPRRRDQVFQTVHMVATALAEGASSVTDLELHGPGIDVNVVKVLLSRMPLVSRVDLSECRSVS